LRIAVDIPVSVSEIVLKGVVQAQHAFVTCWVKGLPENCDRANVRLYASERRLLVEWIGEADSDGVRQINARLAGEVASGECFIRVECGGVSSTPVGLLVT
jgi:hypothetical protein